MERKIWTIPAVNAKSKRARSIPINQSAMLALAEAKTYQTSDYVFGNPKTGQPYTTITRVWYRLKALAGISKMRIHSCRHQAADRILSASNGSLYHVQVALGHSDPRVSQRYARLRMEDLRSAMESTSLFETKLQPVPTTPSATPPEPALSESAEAVITQVEDIATPEQVTPKEATQDIPASNILPFLKVAA